MNKNVEKRKPIRKVSFKRRLIRTFIVTSVAPILAIGLFLVFNVLGIIKNNTDSLMEANLKQTENNIEINIEAYEDLAYQLYTNDDVVEWVRRVDIGQDVPATVNQLRRYMNGLLNTKDYIRAITIVTEGGSIITYDTMTGVSTESSWIDNFSLDIDDIYKEVTSDYRMYTYPTEYATSFANKDYYLFHLAHRIVNYKKLNERIGMVIVSLDEEMLQNIYSSGQTNNDRITYIVDEKGRILSSENKSLIGSIDEDNTGADSKRGAYINSLGISSRWSYIYKQTDDNRGWTIVTYIDGGNIRKTLLFQGLFLAGVALGILLFAMIMTLRITRRLNSDIATVSSGMERAKEGDLTTRIEINNDMPEEVAAMADSYNNMIETIRLANEKEKEATRRHQEAQIAALEAQINPHFLYNTLDTINWMAIEKDEFDISNAINALANILRYAIAKSNARVTVRDEIEWLKKYIFLQQFRLKDKFSCELDVDPDIMEAPIHKLLMQPFIENAIIHGFEDVKGNATIWISLKHVDNNIVIAIRDNGKGMSEDSVLQINSGNIEGKDRTHIGMGNVITRMKMYYGSEASVTADSTIGEGTTITLLIPYDI